MSKHRPAGSVVTAVVIASLLGAAAGCGKEEPAAVLPAPHGAGGYATPELLLERYNELCTRRQTIDRDVVLDLVHAENERQERLLRLARETRPLVELDQALWERFGVGMNPAAVAPPLSPHERPARLRTSIGHRATAAYTRAGGAEDTLYLVLVEERWWLSGHTLERDAGLGALDGTLEAMERTSRYLSPAASSITTRVRGGEFGSVTEVGYALGRAAAQLSPEGPGAPTGALGAAPTGDDR